MDDGADLQASEASVDEDLDDERDINEVEQHAKGDPQQARGDRQIIDQGESHPQVQAVHLMPRLQINHVRHGDAVWTRPGVQVKIDARDGLGPRGHAQGHPWAAESINPELSDEHVFEQTCPNPSSARLTRRLIQARDSQQCKAFVPSLRLRRRLAQLLSAVNGPQAFATRRVRRSMACTWSVSVCGFVSRRRYLMEVGVDSASIDRYVGEPSPTLHRH